jgi:phosphoribosylglycinamide formyltransferase 1
MAKCAVGILISGRGSNMASLIEAARAPDYPAEIRLVIANRPEAAGIEHARAAGIPALVIDHKAYPDKAGFETAMTEALEAHGVELVCLAGFMRLLSPLFINHWHNRLINIHPSLLPSYRGLHAHERALADGVKLAGCTVHFVRVEMDVGPIVAQAAVPVLSDDTADSLAARVIGAEHKLYPAALAMIAEGSAKVVGDRVVTRATDPLKRLFSCDI